MSGSGGRIFGFWTLTFLVVANMVGAGVFTTSGFTLASLHSPGLVLLAWLVGGLIALCGALSYGQLVQRIPVSGGEYAFLREAAHPFAGFVAGWVSLLAGFSGAIAFAAVTLEAYLPTPLPPKVLAITVVLAGAAAHGLRRGIGSGAQNLAVTFKLAFLLVFLGVSAWSIREGGWKGGALQGLEPVDSPLLAFAQALVWISLSYSGFNAGVYVAGEATHPRTVARALIVGTLSVTILYLLLNAVFVLAPPPDAVAGKPDVAVHAAEWIGGDGFAVFLRLLIVLALVTSVLSMMMAGPRVYGRMAVDGLLPRRFVLHPDRPWPPVLLQAALAVLLILLGTVQGLLAYLGLTLSLCAAASVACLLVGRSHCRLQGAARIPPALFVLFTLAAAVLLLLRDPWQVVGTAVTFLVGGAAYLGRRSP